MPEDIKPDVEFTVMAFDYGTRRIGVAVGNTLTRLGQPIKTIAEASGDGVFNAIEEIYEIIHP